MVGVLSLFWLLNPFLVKPRIDWHEEISDWEKDRISLTMKYLYPGWNETYDFSLSNFTNRLKNKIHIHRVTIQKNQDIYVLEITKKIYGMRDKKINIRLNSEFNLMNPIRSM